MGSNHRPNDYESFALTNWATSPLIKNRWFFPEAPIKIQIKLQPTCQTTVRGGAENRTPVQTSVKYVILYTLIVTPTGWGIQNTSKSEGQLHHPVFLNRKTSAYLFPLSSKTSLCRLSKRIFAVCEFSHFTAWVPTWITYPNGCCQNQSPPIFQRTFSAVKL